MTLINNIEIDDIEYQDNHIKQTILYNSPIDDKLHVIIVLFNPANYATRYILAREFIKRMSMESNIILYVVELAFGTQNYYITDSNNKNHLRLRTNCILWYKENLINIAINKLLPKNWKAVAWIDSDIEFESHSWALDALKILNGSKDVIQLFSHTLFLDENKNTDKIFTGFCYQYCKKTKRTGLYNINSFWHTGFAWACNRSFYDKIGKLYEYGMAGNGDFIMASCFINEYEKTLIYDMNNDYKNTLIDFQNKCKNCRIGYVPTVILHHYHGSINNRYENDRNKLLSDYGFSPTLWFNFDLDNGLLIPNKFFNNLLLKQFNDYFHLRNEDDKYVIKQNINTQLVCNKINFIKIMNRKFNLTSNYNEEKAIVINLTKDVIRLKNFYNDIDLLNINNIYKLNAIHYKDTEKMNKTFIKIIKFIQQFDNSIKYSELVIDELFDNNNDDILIKKAPLATYLSHIKAMMYGYHKNKYYTIIMEDDIDIIETKTIENVINSIPEDWDIITFGCKIFGCDKNIKFYKMEGSFYNLHFYIIKNSSFNKIFKLLYPIKEQIDVILLNSENGLIIYNIEDSIIQKKYVSNIQTDLHILFTSENYKDVREYLFRIKNIIKNILDDYLPKNKFNQNIAEYIYYNFLIRLIHNYSDKDDNTINNNNYSELINIYITEYNEMISNLTDVLKHTCKGYNTNNKSIEIINNILYVISRFKLHNLMDETYNEPLKAYMMGSTCSTYILEKNNIIIKEYFDKVEYKIKNHEKIEDIKNNEIEILKKLDLFISSDDNIVKMKYLGETIFFNNKLPDDWIEQIKYIFNEFDKKNIYYREFNIFNFVIKNDKINFVDFGLAKIKNKSNNFNFINFVELINIFYNKTKKFNNNDDDNNLKYAYYLDFLTNMKLKFSKNIY